MKTTIGLVIGMLLIGSVCNGPKKENFVNSTPRQTSTVLQTNKKDLLDADEPYDIETYDIYGNINRYSYDDFEYNPAVRLDGYAPTTHNAFRTAASASNDFSKYLSLPYSAICVVYTTFDTDGDGTGDKTFVGSGTLVGADEILTAEENTYNTVYGYPTNLYVAFGEHRESGKVVRPFGTQNMLAIMRGNFHTTFDANDDWALIRLNSKIGYTTGWLGVSDSNIANGSTVRAVGYDSYSSLTCEASKGSVSSLETYKFNHSANMKMMANGCPILLENSNTVVGIQTSRRVTVNSATLSQACKVSVYIKGWIQEDCGPLRITIYSLASTSGPSSGSGSGHSWLSIRNNTPYNFTVGKMTIAANSAVSLGTWGNTTHVGLYYNLEYLRSRNAPSSFEGRVSYSRNIFSNQWDNSFVLARDKWSIINNCSGFASDVWNHLLPRYSINPGAIPTPTTVKNKIQSYNGYLSNETVYGNGKVGYYNENTFVASAS